MGLKLDETTILENALIYNTIKIIFLRIFKSHGRFSWLDFIGKVQFIFLSKRTSFLQLRKIQRINQQSVFVRNYKLSSAKVPSVSNLGSMLIDV